MHVLNLVTNPDAPFFELQIDALARQGVDATTLGVDGTHDVSDPDSGGRGVVDYARFYARVLRASADSYDVVHANYGLTAPMALAQPNRPVVLSLWGSDLMGSLGRLTQWCARRADAVIVMSEGMAKTLDADCHVIPHGVDLDLFRPIPRQQAQEMVGWRSDAKQVLFPYTLQRPVKNYPRAERVVERARERVDGDVVLQSLHGVPHARMPLYYNAADTLLVTSKREGSPNAVKEALGCNLPVVATDVGDVRERLAGVDSLRVCRTDEELVDGVVDALERGDPPNGRTAVEPLGLDRMGANIRAVYESVR